MPLFECPRCKAVENTAMGQYWQSQYCPKDSSGYKPALCSECATGKWHGEFPKETMAESGMVHGDDGYVYRSEEIAPGGYFHGITKPVKD